MKTKRILVYFLLMGSFIGSLGCSNTSGKNDNKPEAINVEVEEIKTVDGSQIIAYSGTIEESESTPLSFTIMGSVSKVLVKEGDFVKRGQLLATVNDATFRNAYNVSLASKKQAQDAYNRLLPMYKNGNLPEIKFVEVETGLQQASSAAEISRKNLNDCRLYAMTYGIVGKRSIDPGMTCMPGLTAINVVKIEKVFAVVPVSENEIAEIKKGQKAAIKVGALGNEEFAGTVEEIGVMADPIAHTYKIKIGIMNKDRKIKPGMICNVTLNNVRSSKNLVVPNRSVMVDERGKNYVYSVNTSNNTAVRKYIKTGEMLNNGIEVLEGLNNNEIVIVSGQHKLVDNASIHIVKQ